MLNTLELKVETAASEMSRNLSSTVDRLEALSKTLEVKLLPVTRTRPNLMCSEEVLYKEIPPLFSEVREQIARVDLVSNIIEDLIDRCEL